MEPNKYNYLNENLDEHTMPVEKIQALATVAIANELARLNTNLERTISDENRIMISSLNFEIEY